MIKIDRVVKISTIDNGYLLEFHEAKGTNRQDMEEQHHLKSFRTFEELEIELAKMRRQKTEGIDIAEETLKLLRAHAAAA